MQYGFWAEGLFLFVIARFKKKHISKIDLKVEIISDQLKKAVKISNRDISPIMKLSYFRVLAE